MTTTALPTGRGYPRERVAQDFGWHDRPAPPAPRGLGVKLLVPGTWNPDPVAAAPEVSSLALTPLALFSSPDALAYLEVQVVRLEREISAELWLRHFLIVSRHVPETLVTLSALFADSLSDFAISGQPFRGRNAVRIHGTLAFLVSALCVADGYPGLAEAFGVSIASFSPTAPALAETIEARRTATVGGVISFDYPASWRVRSVPPIPGKAAVDLINLTDELPAGLLRIKTTSKTLPTRMELQVEDSLAEFAEAGFSRGPLKTNTGIQIAGDRFQSGFMQMYQGTTTTGLPQELWLVVIEDADTFVTAGLLTPDRRNDFLLWAWNRRVLDIVLETLR